jgi:putative hydroxymethylpyrimidine transport system substrate-binding protein
MRRRLTLLAATIAAATLLAACGEKTDTLTPTASRAQPFSVILDQSPNANDVGLYEALANGDFIDAGLDVRVRVATDPATALRQLADGKVDVAISAEPELMGARDAGELLASIGAVVQLPLASIVSLGSEHITTPAELRGKRVGDAGIPYQHAYLETILKQAGVPASSVKEVNVGDDPVPAMVSGRVDAALASWNYQAIQLREMGRKANVIHVEAAGVPTYDELVVVTTENDIANRNNELRRFVQALGRGYAAVRADPQAGVNALVRANPSLSPKLQLASVQATLSSLFPDDPRSPNLPWGWQDAAQWTAYGKWMLAQHLITNPATVPDASTNQLLAGQGP